MCDISKRDTIAVIFQIISVQLHCIITLELNRILPTRRYCDIVLNQYNYLMDCAKYIQL